MVAGRAYRAAGSRTNRKLGESGQLDAKPQTMDLRFCRLRPSFTSATNSFAAVSVRPSEQESFRYLRLTLGPPDRRGAKASVVVHVPCPADLTVGKPFKVDQFRIGEGFIDATDGTLSHSGSCVGVSPRCQQDFQNFRVATVIGCGRVHQRGQARNPALPAKPRGSA